jgi:hypothetical protein
MVVVTYFIGCGYIDGVQSNVLKELQGIKDKLQNINGALRSLPWCPPIHIHGKNSCKPHA